MFFWRRVAPQIPEEGLKPTATPSYTRNFRDLNDKVSRGKSFSGYERNPLFLNLQGKGFTEMSQLLGVDYDDDARAVASVDWDRDGDLDLWVTNRTAPQVRLLVNEQPSGQSWIAIRVEGDGVKTNRDAIGARLTLWPEGNPSAKQQRTVRAGDGFLAQSSAWAHFGLKGMQGPFTLQVRWPGGGTETINGLNARERHVITQGSGRANPDPHGAVVLKEREPVSAEDPLPSGFWVANQVPFPALECTDPEGKTRVTTDFIGQPLLVNFWATWCAPCVKELGMFGEHAAALRAQGAMVLALNVDDLAVEGSAESNAKPADILAKVGYQLPHGFAQQANLEMIEILIEHYTSRRTPLSIPTSILVDAQGNVASVYTQPVSWEQLSRDLALLNATPADRLKRASPRPGRWFTDPLQIDRSAFLGDYATAFATNGFPKESQRLYALVRPKEGVRTAQELYNQAKSAAQQGQTERAITLYEEAIEIDPEYGQALTGLGALYLTQKKLDEAEPYFARALSVDPNHATALINMAMIDQSKGRPELALQRLQQVLHRNPEYAEAHMNLGSLLASKKRPEEAITHLEQAVAINDQLMVAHLNLAAAYKETNQLDKAIERYLVAQKLNPKMPHAYAGQGSALAAKGEHAQAAGAFQQALKLGRPSPRLYTEFGLSLVAIDKKDVAKSAFEAALKMDPNHAPAKEALRVLSQ